MEKKEASKRDRGAKREEKETERRREEWRQN